MTPVSNHAAPPSRPGLIRAGLLLILFSLAVVTAYRFYDPASAYEVQVFRTPTGWGYSIVSNHRTLIYQPTIPGQSGTVGFASRQQARRVGERVAEKLQREPNLPTLTNPELRELGVTTP